MTKHDEEYVTTLFALLYDDLADYANSKEETDFEDKKKELDSHIARTEAEILRSMKRIGINSSTIVKIINNAFERYDYWQRITRDGSKQSIDEYMVDFFSPENVSKRHSTTGDMPYYQDTLKSIDYHPEAYTTSTNDFVNSAMNFLSVGPNISNSNYVSGISQFLDLLRVISAVSKYVPDQNFHDSKFKDIDEDDFMFTFGEADEEPCYGILVVNGDDSLVDDDLNSPNAISVNNEKTNGLIEAHESLLDVYDMGDEYRELGVIHVMLGDNEAYKFVRALVNYIYYEIVGEQDELFNNQTFVFHLSEDNDLLDNFECIKEIKDHITVDTSHDFYLFDEYGNIESYYLGENDATMIKLK